VVVCLCLWFLTLCCPYYGRNLEERTKLRNDFWSHINNYLEALECPENYFPMDYYADEDKEHPHWRYSASHRNRVVHWLISCATSEAFGDDDFETMNTEKERLPEGSTQQLTSTNHHPPELSTTITASKENSNKNPFSLGFSTGDDEVDHILTILRMKLLIQLEEDQKKINAAVSQVQTVTSNHAKPLKQAKLRKNNAQPPPAKKTNPNNNNKSRGRRR
jgi:RNA transcription, translation and transport factor protein